MKKIFLLLIFLTFFCKVNGQVFSEKDNSLVWELTSKDSKKPSYIVFTTAGTCESNVGLLTKISHLLDKIKIYYTETGIGNPKNEKESQKYAFLSNADESVKKLLPDSVYLQLKSQVSGLVLPDNLDKLSPVMINGIVAKTITPKCNISNNTEAIFINYAVKYKFEIRELLNVQEAFKILNSYGNAYYAAQINYMLQNKETVAADITKKAGLYVNEDMKGLQELYATSHFLNARYNLSELEKERTGLILSRINEAAKTGGALITLDLASVMSGKFNLFSELKNMGYDLRAVND